MCGESVEGECVGRVWRESVWGECGGRVCGESVEGECVGRVWRESVWGECGGRVCVKGECVESVEGECVGRVWRCVWGECGGECVGRVWRESVEGECVGRVWRENAWKECVGRGEGVCVERLGACCKLSGVEGVKHSGECGGWGCGREWGGKCECGREGVETYLCGALVN